MARVISRTSHPLGLAISAQWPAVGKALPLTGKTGVPLSSRAAYTWLLGIPCKCSNPVLIFLARDVSMKIREMSPVCSLKGSPAEPPRWAQLVDACCSDGMFSHLADWEMSYTRCKLALRCLPNGRAKGNRCFQLSSSIKVTWASQWLITRGFWRPGIWGLWI